MKCSSKTLCYPGSGSVARALVLALLLAFLPLMPPGSTGAEEEGPLILIYPDELKIPRGSTATTEVRLENVSDLLKIEFGLRFDPEVVQVVDGDEPHQLARQVGVGEHLVGWSRHRNDVFNEHGFIDFDYYLGPAATPVSGTVQVAVITWRGDKLGASDLIFEAAALSSAGTRIVLRPTVGDVDRVTDGRIEVIVPTDMPMPIETSQPADTPSPIPSDTPSPTRTTPLQTPAGPITGRVTLQGRDAYAGAKVYLTAAPCPAFPSGPPDPDTAADALTDGEGYFQITPAPGGTYPCLLVFRPGYLMAQRPSPQGNLGTITLPAGEVTLDNAIGLPDLTLIARCLHRPGDAVADLDEDCYQTHGERDRLIVDVNEDGWVDIYDLAMAGGNYGREGPVEDWH